MFKDFIDGVAVPEEYEMVSFDVISLFTNISIQRINTVIDKKWTLLMKSTKLKKTFLKEFNFCLVDCNIFAYNNIVYRQKLGTPMGLSLSAVLASLVMDDLVKHVKCVMKRAKLEPLVFFKKYVDDTIVLAHRDEIDDILRILNGYDPLIQFTMEREVDKSIPFLDMKLHRDEGRILTDWFKKEYASGRILDFLSSHSFNIKMNTAMGLIQEFSN